MAIVVTALLLSHSNRDSDPANKICAKYMQSWTTLKSSLFHLQNDFTVSEYSLIF